MARASVLKRFLPNFILLIVMVLGLITGAGTARAATGDHLDFVVDLDWTLFYNIRDPEDPSRVPLEERVSFLSEGTIHHYRASDHAAEFIEALLAYPNARVTFFSGGEADRNEAILKSIRLSDGRTAFEAAHKVFSFEHLTQVSNDPKARFLERYRKRIQDLLPDLNLHRAVLIDDHPEFAIDGLKVVRAYGELNFRPSFESSRVGERYEAVSLPHFQRERDKLAIALGVIDRAYREAQAGKGDFSALAEGMMRDPVSREWLPLMSPMLTEALTQGKALLRLIEARSLRRAIAPQCRMLFGA